MIQIFMWVLVIMKGSKIILFFFFWNQYIDAYPI